MGLLDIFKKNSQLDDEDEDDDQEDEEDDDDEEAESGSGLFGVMRGLKGKLLGRGDDDDDDEDDDEDDYDYGRPAPPPPVQTVSNPLPPVQPTPAPAGAAVAQLDLTAVLGVTALEDRASPDSAEDVPVGDKDVTGLTGDAPIAESDGGLEKIGLPSNGTPAEADDELKTGVNLGNIFEKRVEVNQKLRNLALSQDDTPAEVLAAELNSFLRELEELTPTS